MLGNDIYNKLVEKSNKLLEDSKIEIEENKNRLLIETKKLTENNAASDEIYLRTTELNNNITEAYKKLELAEKINKEVQKMKFGSVAIINQIRVISKQRIYDPKTDFDILSGIKLSNENLDLIDEKIRKMFIKNWVFFLTKVHNIYYNVFRIHLPCNIFYIVYRHERIHVPRTKVRGISNFINREKFNNKGLKNVIGLDFNDIRTFKYSDLYLNAPTQAFFAKKTG